MPPSHNRGCLSHTSLTLIVALLVGALTVADSIFQSALYNADELAAFTGHVHVRSGPNDHVFVEVALTAKADAPVVEAAHLHKTAVQALPGKNGIGVLYLKQFQKQLSERRT